MAEHYGQNLRAEEVQQRHEEDRHRAEQRDELLARVAGVLLLSLSDVLARNGCAAGRHRRENVDHQIADRVDERHRADRRVADGRNHQRVGKTHCNGQKLLEQQRPHQRDELAIRKHHFLVSAHRRCQFAHGFTLLVSIEPVS